MAAECAQLRKGDSAPAQISTLSRRINAPSSWSVDGEPFALDGDHSAQREGFVASFRIRGSELQIERKIAHNAVCRGCNNRL